MFFVLIVKTDVIWNHARKGVNEFTLQIAAQLSLDPEEGTTSWVSCYIIEFHGRITWFTDTWGLYRDAWCTLKDSMYRRDSKPPLRQSMPLTCRVYHVSVPLGEFQRVSSSYLLQYMVWVHPCPLLCFLSCNSAQKMDDGENDGFLLDEWQRIICWRRRRRESAARIGSSHSG